MATPPDFVSGAVLEAAQLNKIGVWKVKDRTTFTAASTITADNIFTADFDNYKIMLTFTSASTTNNASLQLRAGGVTANTNYNKQQLFVSSTSASASRSTAQTSFLIGTYDDAETCVTDITLWNPQATTETVFQLTYSLQGTAATPEMGFEYGNHSTSSSYDGFIITAASGTVTGYYTVYGWNQ